MTTKRRTLNKTEKRALKEYLNPKFSKDALMVMAVLCVDLAEQGNLAAALDAEDEDKPGFRKGYLELCDKLGVGLDNSL
jgi:hypothetical protein